MVFSYGNNEIVRNRVQILRIMGIDIYLVTIIPVQSITGANPHKTPAILKDTFNGTV